MNFPDQIETDRLVLGPYKPSDLTGHVDVLANWAVTQWLSHNIPFPYRKEDGKKFITEAMALTAARKSMFYAITDKDTGRHVGGIRIFTLTPETEVGYWMHQDFWGKGLGTELLRAVMRVGFDSGIITCFVAQTAENNVGSRRILERIGFSHSGIVPPEYTRCGHTEGCTEFYHLPIDVWRRLQKKDDL